MLTKKRLREVLHYSPKTGVFKWRVHPKGRRLPGLVAGSLSKGYILIRVDGQGYLAHRLVWLYMKGRWPPRHLDHKNGMRSDNRMSNLRIADERLNGRNAKRYAHSLSGFKGVRIDLNCHNRKYQARIKLKDRRVSLGYFSTAEAAHAAYCAAAKKHFGAFARSY